MIVTFAIGNSDDKLTQQEWAAFLGEVHTLAAQVVHTHVGVVVQFMGYSAPGAPWQNALWAIELPDDPDPREALRGRLKVLAGRYRQDAVAWWESGRTEMLTPNGGVM